jgi:hypothetical protein
VERESQVDGTKTRETDSPSGESLMWKEGDAWQAMSG